MDGAFADEKPGQDGDDTLVGIGSACKGGALLGTSGVKPSREHLSHVLSVLCDGKTAPQP
jgi:hypothetical protein